LRGDPWVRFIRFAFDPGTLQIMGVALTAAPQSEKGEVGPPAPQGAVGPQGTAGGEGQAGPAGAKGVWSARLFLFVGSSNQGCAFPRLPDGLLPRL